MKRFILVAAVLLAAACSAGPSAPPTPAKAATTALTPAGAVGVVLDTYEQLRSSLAADKNDDVLALAQKIEAAARTMVEEKKPAAAEVLAGASALTALGDKPDLAKARVAFGELSRGVVGVVAADPTLQKGRFLNECPMAKGYQRWVQVEEQLSNPYMGKRMLTCGEGLAAWKVEGI